MKNCGYGAVDAIVAARELGGAFTSFYDFCARVDTEIINKRAVESLIRAGAFDGTGATRSQLLTVYERALDGAGQVRKRNVAGQVSLFDDGMVDAAPPPLPQVQEHSRRALLSMEKEITGVYITGHPLDEYQDELERLDTSTRDIEELAEQPDHGLSHDGRVVSIGGIVVELRTKATKSGNLMAFVTLEDLTGQIEALIFPKVYERYMHQFTVDALLVLSGKLSMREDEPPKLLLDTVTPLEHSGGKPAKGIKLYLKVPGAADMEPLNALLAKHPGKTQVIFYLTDTKQQLLAPRSLWVTPGQGLMSQLSQGLGVEAVKLV